jgi:hypothetical protein
MNENVRVIARHDDGSETDVTEGVQALYDHCVSSMDWGSGFLDNIDAAGIVLIAQKCGFLVPEEAAEKFEEYIKGLHTVYREYGTGRFVKPRRSTAACVECQTGVYFIPAYYKPEVYEQQGVTPGWYHVDQALDSHHPVKLWPVA